LAAIPSFAQATELTDLAKRLEFRQKRLLLREISKVEDPPERGWLAVSMQ
jgi:hypothetical protein